MDEFTGINPNSQHQLWGRWTFVVMASSIQPSQQEVLHNARKYFRMAFPAAWGRYRCDVQVTPMAALYAIIAELEGPDVRDLAFVERIKIDFEDKFVKRGFGPSASLARFEVSLLAGDAQDGKPPAQLLVMPRMAPGVKMLPKQ